MSWRANSYRYPELTRSNGLRNLAFEDPRRCCVLWRSISIAPGRKLLCGNTRRTPPSYPSTAPRTEDPDGRFSWKKPREPVNGQKIYAGYQTPCVLHILTDAIHASVVRFCSVQLSESASECVIRHLPRNSVKLCATVGGCRPDPVDDSG
jgi:hypothetical protein